MDVPRGTRVLLRRPEPVGTKKTPTPRRLCPLARPFPWIWAVTRGPGSGLRLGRGRRENGRHDDLGSPCSSLRSFCLAWCSFSRRDSMVASGWGLGGGTHSAPSDSASRIAALGSCRARVTCPHRHVRTGHAPFLRQVGR